jgi:hypothetical protein
MLADLSKAFSAYSRKPLNFAWCSLLYIIMLLLFSLACVGLFVAYFLLAAAFNHAVSFSSLSTILVSALIVIIFLFFANGLNGALAVAYRRTMGREKTSLMTFYSEALSRAPVMFALMLIRDLIWLLVVGPVIAAYILVLQDYMYADIGMAAYLLAMTFLIHMVFTPALISAGAYGTGMMPSLRNMVRLLRKKHIYFIGLYIAYAITWLLSFVPFIQLATLFFAYPIAYGAMISMMENGIRIEMEED